MVVGVKNVCSSGSRVLDVSACNTIKRAAPFPPIPEEINKKQLNMQINIAFKLK
jgi:protein TonB